MTGGLVRLALAFRGLGLAAACGAGLLATAPAVDALTYDERQALDLSAYAVTRPDASYLDVPARMGVLREAHTPLLMALRNRLDMSIGCRAATTIPIIDFNVRVPRFHRERARWEEVARALFAFEDAVSNLGAAYVASGDPYYADCLLGLLDRWARHGAIIGFRHSDDDEQAWYATESMIFAAALAYSMVRQAGNVDPEQRRRIEDWLVALARRHSGIRGQSNSCCNNHFYRRALYATVIGIMVEDQDLFRFGVSAVYSALSELTEEGALPREMIRGDRAGHYHNYSLLYLVPTMHLIARQGYPIFDLEVGGNTIDDAVAFALDVIEDPMALDGLAPTTQWHGYLADPQFFAWMEVWLLHRDDARVAAFIRRYRPIYNRSMMGHVTLLLMAPSAQRMPGDGTGLQTVEIADFPEE